MLPRKSQPFGGKFDSSRKIKKAVGKYPVNSMNDKKWVVYLVRCSDHTLYCGISNNLNRRLQAHNSGNGARYTRSRRPLELAGVSPEMTKSEALKLEHRIKRFPANQKLQALTQPENPATVLEKDLTALRKTIRALEKRLDKLIAAVETGEKPEFAGESKPQPAKVRGPGKADKAAV